MGFIALRAADVPWGKPELSSIRYPADLCLHKPGTDVIVGAIAHAPGGQPRPTFDAGARVGRVSKVVRVHGPRVWLPDGEGVGEARPLLALELRYDHAFGGVDASGDGPILEDARNPVGLGIARNRAALTMKPAPQIEDPAEPIKNASARPTPAGLGATGRHWAHRRALWGTHDAAWLEKRATLPAQDLDDREGMPMTPTLTRRKFIEGGLALGAGLAAGSCTHLFDRPASQKVTVTVVADAFASYPSEPDPGFCIHVETVTGGKPYGLLFDCGIQGPRLLDALGRCGIGPGSINAVVLSHGHPDHAKGSLPVLEFLNQLGSTIPIYVTSGVFGDQELLERLSQYRLERVAQKTEVLPGIFATVPLPGADSDWAGYDDDVDEQAIYLRQNDSPFRRAHSRGRNPAGIVGQAV